MAAITAGGAHAAVARVGSPSAGPGYTPRPVHIYLDHNATTPVRPEVADAMAAALRGLPGNPSSVHAPGRAARAAIEEARAEVAALVGAEAEEIVFTSGGTEGNDLAIRGLLAGGPSPALSPLRGASGTGRAARRVVAASSTRRCWRRWRRRRSR